MKLAVPDAHALDGFGAWSSAKKAAALCLVAASLPLGIGVGIMLAPGRRGSAPPAVLVSLLVLAIILGAGALLLWWRRHWSLKSPRGREVDVPVDDLMFGLLPNISHELRTPLNSIIGFSELLLTETASTLSTRHRQYLADVLGSGQQLLGVVNDLIALSKVAAGTLPLEREELAPGDLVADAFEALTEEAAAREVLLVARDTSTRKVQGDRTSLQKALVHVVANGLRFSPPGGTLEVAVEDANGEVEFRVRDHGPVRDRALAAGTGLGLVISKRLIEEHGGRLVMESDTAGHGTTFRLSLPARATGVFRSLPHPGAAS
jgi:signal transduction histidine kinase